MDTFFFFLMTRGPPRSPLFPTTPLSRSAAVLYARPALRFRMPQLPPPRRFAAALLLSVGYQATIVVTLLAAVDRKSTRLNSSHANISYAVFCLKKKKKNRTYTNTLITPH